MVNKRVTGVTYHFVRNLARSRYPEIKGLPTDSFRYQLNYLTERYTPVRMEDVVQAARDPEYELPPNSLLLTFDDGYLDHFTSVFPLLYARGLQGCFFVPARAVQERRVLDVNKIHFTLASVADKTKLITTVFELMDEYREEFDLAPNDAYYRELAVADRFDPAEVIFVKRLLQKALPERARKLVVDRVFRQFVTTDEATFAEELYLNTDQLKCMLQAGMHLGAHGVDHRWLDTLSPQTQEQEIEGSLRFLCDLGAAASSGEWVISYPYGAYNDTLLQLLERKGCALGFTVGAAVTDLSAQHVLKAPRFDTNDFPQGR